MLNLFWADAVKLPIPADLGISEYRKEKLARLRPESARRCSLCAEFLLIEAVRRANGAFPLPLHIQSDPFGKPFLSGREYEFSLSHSGRYAACALADFPLGLDIQTLSKCDEKLVRRFFTEKEQGLVFTAEDRDAAFTALWCRKESYLKAIGLGLRKSLDSFDVSDTAVVLHDEKTDYVLRERRTGELFFCLCVPWEKRGEELTIRRPA